MNDPEPQELAIDAEASEFMQEGIRLMQSQDLDAALLCFDRALELRRQLSIAVPIHAYGLAACWLNRAEALTQFGPTHHESVLRAYDEALALLRQLPLGDDARFSKRLAIAHQNRALILASQSPPATAEAIAGLAEAITVLEHAEAMNAAERDYLLAVVSMNLANLQVSGDTTVANVAARERARRALALVKPQEHENAAAAETGLNARHVLCRIVARRLSGEAKSEEIMEDIHEATDLAEEGLALVREWEQRGVERFRSLAGDLLRFGAQVYAYYQRHFLRDFLTEQLDPEQSTDAYVQSREIQDAALAVILLLPPSSPEDGL